jgi:phosphotriesterase-related protein
VDLRGPLAPNYAQADPEMVVQLMQPYLASAEAAGVTAFVDCAPLGVGRNVPVLRRLAQMTPIHIIAPTGVYRDGFIPPDLMDVSAEQLADLWVRELAEGMDDSDSRAGFIKIAMSENADAWKFAA